MQVSQIQYVSHVPPHRVAIVYCPTICERLLHFSHDEGTESGWRLRDFVTGKIIGKKHDEKPDAAQIENLVIVSEGAPYYSIEHVNEWKAYMKLRSLATIRQPDFESAPKSVDGLTWDDM